MLILTIRRRLSMMHSAKGRNGQSCKMSRVTSPPDHDPDQDPDPERDAGDVPDRILLRASAQRWIWVLIGSVVFVALGAGVALGNRVGAVATVIGAMVAVLFGACAVVALRQMLSPGSLLITRTSITLSAAGRLSTFELADCGPFTAWRNPSRGNVMVLFDHVPTGASRSLPETYGVPPQELADLLESIRTSAH